jgi:hypothetical protein
MHHDIIRRLSSLQVVVVELLRYNSCCCLITVNERTGLGGSIERSGLGPTDANGIGLVNATTAAACWCRR